MRLDELKWDRTEAGGFEWVNIRGEILVWHYVPKDTYDITVIFPERVSYQDMDPIAAQAVLHHVLTPKVTP